MCDILQFTRLVFPCTQKGEPLPSAETNPPLMLKWWNAETESYCGCPAASALGPFWDLVPCLVPGYAAWKDPVTMTDPHSRHCNIFSLTMLPSKPQQRCPRLLLQAPADQNSHTSLDNWLSLLALFLPFWFADVQHCWLPFILCLLACVLCTEHSIS